VKYVHTATRGLSRARNIGAEHAGTDMLVFSDDDVLATEGWPLRMISELDARGPRFAATGRVDAGPRERSNAFVHATVTETAPAVHSERGRRDVLAGGNCAMHRSTLEALGGWDERLGAGSRYPAAEDNDFGYRLLQGGWQIAYVPDAVLVHRAWRPSTEYLSLRWRYGLGKGGFYAKHLSLRDRHMLHRLGRDLGTRARRAPRGLVAHPRQVFGDAAYVTGVLTAILSWRLGR
jgi:GT2 family glycosyltransferase